MLVNQSTPVNPLQMQYLLLATKLESAELLLREIFQLMAETQAGDPSARRAVEAVAALKRLRWSLGDRLQSGACSGPHEAFLSFLP